MRELYTVKTVKVNQKYEISNMKDISADADLNAIQQSNFMISVPVAFRCLIMFEIPALGEQQITQEFLLNRETHPNESNCHNRKSCTI